MTTTTAAPAGRPLDEELSAAILDAALVVLGRDGYGGFSIAAVAQAAEVHRPAIYRRWPNKVDLAVAAIEQLRPAPVDRESGDARADVIAFLVDAGSGANAQDDLALRLHGELAIHPELADAVRQRLVLPRRRTLRTILERGMAAGRLRPDLDPELAMDLLFGVLHASKGTGKVLRPKDVERYVDLAFGGLACPE
jgi:AcrR family transcriptional regulator